MQVELTAFTNFAAAAVLYCNLAVCDEAKLCKDQPT